MNYRIHDIFTIKTPPGSTWGSKDREEPIELESIAKFCNHQVKNEILAKNHGKVAVLCDF